VKARFTFRQAVIVAAITALAGAGAAIAVAIINALSK
jgi:hypothetical protein